MHNIPLSKCLQCADVMFDMELAGLNNGMVAG